MEREPIIYDDYNSRIKADQSCINTLTTNCGNESERNGVKLLEPIALDEQNNTINTEGTVGTLTTDGSSPKHNNRVIEPICDTLCINSKVDGKQPSLGNRVYDTRGCSTTVATTTFFTGSIQSASYRIRKLTERECWRLMGVKDEDYEKVAAGQSKSSMYHLAGDSIVTAVLMALFGELLGIEWQSKVKDLADEITKGE